MKREEAYQGKLRPVKSFLGSIALTALAIIIYAFPSSAQDHRLSGYITTTAPIAAGELQQRILSDSLEVGDKIPENIWNLPLQVVNHSQGKKIITLNNYRGKLIILDFWATWCGSCIEYMPKMNRLQASFGEKIQILPVTYQYSDRIESFWIKNTILKSLQLPSVVEDTVLKMLFPHKMVPHLVWISPEGRYVGATSSYDARQETIRKFLDDQPVSFTSPKHDQVTYDREKPLFIDGNGGENEHYLYRSMITPAIDGIPSRLGRDSEEGMIRLIATNQSVPSLYKQALRIPTWWPPNRIRFEGVDRRDYIIENWHEEKIEKAFCYELLLPADRTADSYRIMLEDLNRFFQLKGRIEKRTAPCYVLKRISLNRLPAPVGNTKENNYSGGKPGKKYQRNQPLSVLVGHLNRLSDTLIVLDETNFERPLDLDLTEDLSDFISLNKILSGYGLQLLEEKRKIELLIISADQ